MAGRVGAKEFFKDTVDLRNRDLIPLIAHRDRRPTLVLPGANLDGGVQIAVADRVAQQVVEHPRQLVGIADQMDFIPHIDRHRQLLFFQQRIKLLHQLLQHHPQVNAVVVQLDGLQIKASDIEEFVDQLLQPVRFVQRDGGILGALLHRQVGRFLQQAQIADHRSERCFQIVRQIHHQVVFALFRLPRRLLIIINGILQVAQRHFGRFYLVGEFHDLLSPADGGNAAFDRLHIAGGGGKRRIEAVEGADHIDHHQHHNAPHTQHFNKV